MNRVAIFISFMLVIVSFGLKAEVSLKGGMNICGIVDDNLIDNKRFFNTGNLGVSIKNSIKYNPKFYIQNDILINRKGYTRMLEHKQYYRFDYLTFTLLGNYRIIDYVTYKLGIEYGRLINVNVKKWNETYKKNEFAIVTGFSIFDNKLIGGYFRCSYGITPVLDYYKFDKLGNMEPISDIHNVCFSLGININLPKK